MSDSEVQLPAPKPSGKGVSELALERKYCTKAQIVEAIREQTRLAGLGVQKDLRRILYERKAITREQSLALDCAVRGATVIAGFEILQKVGQGGMGAVFRARQIALEREVALKILPPKLARDKAFVARFIREARFSAKLDHLNLINGIECGESGGYIFFAMEFVEGRSAADLIRRKGKLSLDESRKIIRQTAEALVYAQRHGLVHRDVKPDNIMVTPQGVAKLCDLGLAKAGKSDDIVTGRARRNADASLTQSGQAVGTPHYISPEQARGERDVDIRSDLYSLGASWYHMLSGRTPFDGSNAATIMGLHISDEAPSPCELNPEVPEAYGAIIARLMAKDHKERYENPKDLLDDLDAAEAGLPVRAWAFKGESSCAMPRRGAKRGAGLHGRQATSAKKHTTLPAMPIGGDRTTRIGPASQPAPFPAGLLAVVAVLGLLAVGVLFAPRHQAAPPARTPVAQVSEPDLGARMPFPVRSSERPALPAATERPAEPEGHPIGTFGPAQSGQAQEAPALEPSKPALPKTTAPVRPEPVAPVPVSARPAVVKVKAPPPTEQGIAQAAAIWGEFLPKVRNGQIAEALPALAQRRASASSGAHGLLDEIKADLEGLAALRQAAVDELRKQTGQTVQLHKSRNPFTGIVTQPGADGTLTLKVNDGAELTLKAESLEFPDAERYAPKEGSAEQARLRAVIRLLQDDFKGAREEFAKTQKAGASGAAAAYLHWMDGVDREQAERNAAKALAGAEALFSQGRPKEAKEAYENFLTAHGQTKVCGAQASTIKARLERLTADLNPKQAMKPGLAAIYCKGMYQANPTWGDEEILFRRTDPNIDFNWGEGFPAPGVPKDYFRARWTGYLKVEKAGTYSFLAEANDGMRLWVAGQPVIQAWSIGNSQFPSEKAFLTVGMHEFKLEYLEATGPARCKLAWACENEPSQAIPPESFFTGSPAEAAAASAALAVAPPVAPTATLTRASKPAALLICNQADPGDLAIRDRLRGLGFEVTDISDANMTAAQVEGKALVLVSSHALPKELGPKLRDVRTPVLVWQPRILDDLGMAGSARNQDFGWTTAGTAIVLPKPFQGYSGEVALLKEPAELCFGRPSGAAHVIALHKDDPARVAIFGYEPGAQMVGHVAPARRASFPLPKNATLALTPQGWALFDAWVKWTAGAQAPAAHAGQAALPAAPQVLPAKLFNVPPKAYKEGAEYLWQWKDAQAFDLDWKLDDPREQPPHQPFMRLAPAPNVLLSFKGTSGEFYGGERLEACVVTPKNVKLSCYRLEILYGFPRTMANLDGWGAGIGLWNGKSSALVFGPRKIADGPLSVWGTFGLYDDIDEKTLPRKDAGKLIHDQGYLALNCDGKDWVFQYRHPGESSETSWKEIHRMAARSGYQPVLAPWTFKPGHKELPGQVAPPSRLEFNVQAVRLVILPGDPLLLNR